MPATHHLPASAATCHWGFLDAKLPPVLRMKSGDRLDVDTVSGMPHQMPKAGFTAPPEIAEIHAKCERGPGPHILNGPVHVEGAEPGDVLEVRILDVKLRQDWGYNVILPLSGSLPEDFPESHLKHIRLDPKAMVGEMPWGAKVPLRPFFGIMSTAPRPEYGRITSVVPREFGGNIDNKELVAGTTLYLPVFVPGAGFSVGDGHAVQGDGEVCLTAIETGLSGSFELIVRKDLRFDFPRAETPTHWITMGMDADLDDAAKQALRGMIALIVEKEGIPAHDAYTLCSLACDLRVTQLVDGNKGIHAMLAKSLLIRGK